jgi:hypothetical protein
MMNKGKHANKLRAAEHKLAAGDGLLHLWHCRINMKLQNVMMVNPIIEPSVFLLYSEQHRSITTVVLTVSRQRGISGVAAQRVRASNCQWKQLDKKENSQGVAEQQQCRISVHFLYG